MDIKALTFDVFGTVVDWRQSIAREAEAILGRRLGHELNWLAFADAWRAKYQPAMARVREGKVPWVKLDVLHRENLVELLRENNIDDLDPAQVDELNLAWHRLDGWPDSTAGLIRLKRKFILATLSNGNIALIVNMARHAGLPWDAVLGAEVAGAYKPTPEAYQRSAEALSLAPAECLMVAAHNGDLVAAAAQGFRTAFVARPSEYGPDQVTDKAAEHAFDFACEDFHDLADQLGCE